MSGKGASESRGSGAQTILYLTIVLVGLGLLVAGVVAVFVSSNSSASAALIVVGPASLLVLFFRDRIQEATMRGFEIKLAVQVKNQLRAALNLTVKGNYEASEWEPRQAFERFVGEVDVEEYRAYTISREYHKVVVEMLEQIVRKDFGGRVQN